MDEQRIVEAVAAAEATLGVTPGYSVMHRGRFIVTLNRLTSVVQPKQTTRVADIGVWPGYQCLALDQLGYQVTGYDLQPERLPPLPFPVLQQDFNENLRLRTSDRSFEAIVATEILEHLQPEKIHEWMSGLRDALVPNGWLVLTTPNRKYLGSLLQSHIHGTDADGHGHTKEYTTAEMRKLFGEGWKHFDVTTIDAYRGVGIVSIKEYYRPLSQWWRHPRKLHNLMKLVLGDVQRICPPVRDTILVMAQRAGR